MTPILSIIIPCYNSENTLEETLISVLDQDFEPWEAIIINDGSPDNLEAIAQKYVKKDSRFKYFKKENGGLASARNFGINQSKGKYILPLDSDNKVQPIFAQKAIQVFNENPNIGVVYGDAMYFGEWQGLWKVGKFNKNRILNHNYIDACAIIKKESYDTVGFYDENLPHQGHEDWDFWLRVIENKIEFFYLEEITFNYRVSSNSMIRSFNDKMVMENIKYLRNKHQDLYFIAFEELFEEVRNYKKSQKTKKKTKKNTMRKILKKIFR